MPSHPIGHNVEPFFDKKDTGDGKWILYEIIQNRYITSNNSKTEYLSTKSTALFTVGWERSSALRVAETGTTINADVHCNHPDKFNVAAKEVRLASASGKGTVFRAPCNGGAIENLCKIIYNKEKMQGFESVSDAVADYFNNS